MSILTTGSLHAHCVDTSAGLCRDTAFGTGAPGFGYGGFAQSMQISPMQVGYLGSRLGRFKPIILRTAPADCCALLLYR